MDMLTIGERLRALSANPYNISGRGYVALTVHDFTGARFEREGRDAPLDAECPYNAGTMAATRWQAGNDYAYGYSRGERGHACPARSGDGVDAAFHGWQDCMASMRAVQS